MYIVIETCCGEIMSNPFIIYNKEDLKYFLFGEFTIYNLDDYYYDNNQNISILNEIDYLKFRKDFIENKKED